MALPRGPMLAGAGAALLAALTFGATAPWIALVSQRVGPLSIACLLYAGAAASSLVPQPGSSARGAPFRASQTWPLLGMALAGGALAPTLLAWGLARTGATSGSLLLNLEAVFTVLLARLFYREHLGMRAVAALGLITLGGLALTLDAFGGGPWSLLGALAVTLATLSWAIDNTLSRGLAQQDPLLVVAAKGSLGALVTASVGYALGERLPTWRDALLLLGCGASGYGLSLRLYLRAQRRIGAARTGSIFAVAPFVGAALGLTLGDRTHAGSAMLAAPFFLCGLWLHLTERHRHAHVHEAQKHEHPHRHDDGHHEHAHNPPFDGEHSHEHEHARTEHEHEHAPDLHHDHTHS